MKDEPISNLIDKEDITKLFYFYLNYSEYSSTQTKQLKSILSNVVLLMASECKIATIDNVGGELCSSYPPKIIIPFDLIDTSQKEKKHIRVKFAFSPKFKLELIDHQKDDIVSVKRNSPTRLGNNLEMIEESILSNAPFSKVIEECRFARVHGRFPVPVIFYGERYVLRSGTLSRGVESIVRNISSSVMGFFTDNKVNKLDSNMLHQRFVRQWDGELLRRLGCKYIIDLMVENKKVKYGLTMCTSEKCEKMGIYNRQEIEVLPYPGRESFVFKGKTEGKQYQFRWSDSGTYDAELSMSIETKIFNRDFGKWRDWNLIEITQNYLLYILNILANGKKDEGVLIHCVSGWDRTPLFISLIRITLWADGEIHNHLTVDQLLYLTIAYDWMLFQHSLTERLQNYEEVLRFCFDFLQFIESDEYSIHRWKKDQNLDEVHLSILKKLRVVKLQELRERFGSFYHKIVRL